MSSTSFLSHLEHVAAEERKSSIQALLSRPLITAETDRDDDLVRIRRHSRSLAKWFLTELGYRLIVDGDFARLQKVGRPPHAVPRGLRTSSGRRFASRHYVLFSLVLASLEREGSQTTLARMAEDLTLRAPEIPGFALDFDQARDRRAFVHATRAIADLGVLRRIDGDEERFARGEEGADALYGVHHRRLGQLLSSPASPSAADAPEDLEDEPYPETDEGRNRRIRHRIMRALVEEAVLYFAELDREDRDYFARQRTRILTQLEEAVGLVPELRAEGVLAVDPDARVTDRQFPGIGTVAHAALLTAMRLSSRLREGEDLLSAAEIGSMIREFREEHGRYWSAEFTGGDRGVRRLADRVLTLLEEFRLVSVRGGVVAVHPAVARFAAGAPALAAEETP